MWDQYLKLGWSVFPIVHRSKKPAIKWKVFQQRHPTKEEVQTWKTRLTDPNIALATGAVSKVIVLDIDSEEGWEYLKQHKLGLPVTPRVRTSPGKEHIYFKHPGRVLHNWARRLPGMDIRADGGYVLLPPSMHPSGHVYSWVEELSVFSTPIAECPAWLIKTFDFENDPISMDSVFVLEPEWVKEIMGGVEKGRRNECAAKLAGRYLAFNLTENEVINLLLQWNRNNNPPLKEKEIYTVYNSIARAEGRRRLTTGIEDIGQQAKGKGKKQEPQEDEPTDDDLLDPEERRRVTLESLSTKLRLPIADVMRIGGDEVKLIFRVNGHETWVTIAQLTSHRTFQVKMAELTSRIIPKIKSDEWLMICQLILNVAREIDPGPDATMKGQIEEMLVRYLEAVPPDKVFNDLHPFVYEKEGIAIFLTKFAEWIKLAHDLNLPSRTLAQRLKTLGAELRIKKLGNKTRRIWVLPLKLSGLSQEEFDRLCEPEEKEDQSVAN